MAVFLGGEWMGRIQEWRVGVWYDANQEEVGGERQWNCLVMEFLWRANRKEAVVLLWLSLGRNSKRQVGDWAEYKIPHFPSAWSAWLRWSRGALGQVVEGEKRELVAENICLVGGILSLVTTAMRLGAQQESAEWAGGGRGNRETQTQTWQQSSEVPDMKSASTKPFTFSLPSSSFLASASSHW